MYTIETTLTLSLSPTMTNEQELTKLAKTDEQAFSKLYDIYFQQIFGYITKRINNRAEAEDIVSQIFLKVVEQIHKFNPEVGNFKAWIYTIATNTLIDHFRRIAHSKSNPIEKAEKIPDPAKNPNEYAKEEANRELVLSVINQLPKQYQKILLLRYFSDLSIEEIAEALKINPNNTSVKIHRALKAFQITYLRYAKESV